VCRLLESRRGMFASPPPAILLTRANGELAHTHTHARARAFAQSACRCNPGTHSPLCRICRTRARARAQLPPFSEWRTPGKSSDARVHAHSLSASRAAYVYAQRERERERERETERGERGKREEERERAARPRLAPEGLRRPFHLFVREFPRETFSCRTTKFPAGQTTAAKWAPRLAPLDPPRRAAPRLARSRLPIDTL